MNTQTEELFKIGDVVQLKSGGPQMTVKDLGNEHQPNQVACVWFNSQFDLREATFHFDMLLQDLDIDETN
jgi:uncharacterized protein YodC (DUF2158 family)